MCGHWLYLGRLLFGYDQNLFYKEVTNRQQEVYNLVLKANEEAEKAVAPGVSLSSLDQIARGIITEQGYGAAFTHRLGHFIGLEAHEFGDVSSASTDQAVAGNIFSIESRSISGKGYGSADRRSGARYGTGT